MKVAISGKGGVGKTTVSAGLIEYFASEGNKVYAVDADPDISLGSVLGIENYEVDNIKPIVDMRDVIAQKTGGNGAFVSLNPDVDEILQEYIIQKENINFLKMGAVKQGGTACYCRENTILSGLINSLVLKNEEYVFLDMGAGIEHLSRGTANGVDIMIVVSEPTKVSVQTAKTVKKMAAEIGVKEIKFIGNKIRTEKEKKYFESEFDSDEIIGLIPFSDEILDSALENEGMRYPQEISEIAKKIKQL